MYSEGEDDDHDDHKYLKIEFEFHHVNQEYHIKYFPLQLIRNFLG